MVSSILMVGCSANPFPIIETHTERHQSVDAPTRVAMIGCVPINISEKYGAPWSSTVPMGTAGLSWEREDFIDLIPNNVMQSTENVVTETVLRGLQNSNPEMEIIEIIDSSSTNFDSLDDLLLKLSKRYLSYEQFPDISVPSDLYDRDKIWVNVFCLGQDNLDVEITSQLCDLLGVDAILLGYYSTAGAYMVPFDIEYLSRHYGTTASMHIVQRDGLVHSSVFALNNSPQIHKTKESKDVLKPVENMANNVSLSQQATGHNLASLITSQNLNHEGVNSPSVKFDVESNLYILFPVQLSTAPYLLVQTKEKEELEYFSTGKLSSRIFYKTKVKQWQTVLKDIPYFIIPHDDIEGFLDSGMDKLAFAYVSDAYSSPLFEISLLGDNTVEHSTSETRVAPYSNE